MSGASNSTSGSSSMSCLATPRPEPTLEVPAVRLALVNGKVGIETSWEVSMRSKMPAAHFSASTSPQRWKRRMASLAALPALPGCSRRRCTCAQRDRAQACSQSSPRFAESSAASLADCRASPRKEATICAWAMAKSAAAVCCSSPTFRPSSTASAPCARAISTSFCVSPSGPPFSSLSTACARCAFVARSRMATACPTSPASWKSFLALSAAQTAAPYFSAASWACAIVSHAVASAFVSPSLWTRACASAPVLTTFS
mmetsp:Transcript_90969/g.294427  ORF Transcript_90969/g.294427 Transcript_90969/m.294427 type:complete len:258 (-) Transcript_90969:1557-2330(-)